MNQSKFKNYGGDHMSSLIKDRYHYESIHKVALDIKSVYKEFQVDEFMESTVDASWNSLEMKDRIIKISKTLGEYLPKNYNEAINIIDKVVMNYGDWLDSFAGFFPTFVDIYGQNIEDWDISMGALERYTLYASSEFAVRVFIIKDEKRMMKQMLKWSTSDNGLVRRLSCEGCRPALPWGQALTSFKKDPTSILPILENLKEDASIHVRKSVANNVNDISKTHPSLVIAIAKEWYGKSKETDWIVKHGCRTLLKRGNRDALAFFGYDNAIAITVENFALSKASICIGEDISFSFVISTKQAAKVRLEYGIDYVKANGKRNRKIFKISEMSLNDNEQKQYTKKRSFADLSTRKHYAGVHSIALIVNGMEQALQDFELHI